jgi:Flp pilus assembly protein TadG
MAMLWRSLRRLHHDESGQDVLEFVMLMPFFLFLFFVILDVGVLVDRQQILTHAAREAARLGAVGQSETAVRDEAVAQAQSLLATAAVSCPLAPADKSCLEVTWVDGPDSNGSVAQTGDGVAVRVRYRFQLINPFISWLPFTEIEIGTCAESRLESPPPTATDRGWTCTS